MIDPLGFALENFDVIGGWRTIDEAGKPVDASGTTTSGTPVKGLSGLRALLLERPEQFPRTVTEKLLAYALGRGLDGYDDIVVDRMAASVAKDGYRMGTLVVQVVSSYPFTHRRIRDLKGPSNAK